MGAEGAHEEYGKKILLRKESAANRLELCGPSECLSGCNFGFQGKLRVQLCL